MYIVSTHTYAFVQFEISQVILSYSSHRTSEQNDLPHKHKIKKKHTFIGLSKNLYKQTITYIPLLHDVQMSASTFVASQGGHRNV
jgi:hypothetical protein